MTIWAIRGSLGYDDMGNNPQLLLDTDKQAIENGKFTRVHQDVSCTCGYAYRLHPQVQGALWLRRACTGLVKV